MTISGNDHITLLSWNLAGRVRKAPSQIAFIAERAPHIVAFQEVTKNTLPILKDALGANGYDYTADSFSEADGALLVGPRRYGELIGSRFPISRLPANNFDLPWPERVLSVMLEAPGIAIELHTTHIPPGSSNGWVKIETLEGIFRRLAKTSATARILCGDFNTPQKELSDGTVVTFGQTIRPNGEVFLGKRVGGREDPTGRWDAGERNILCGLKAFDMPDIFRALHGYSVREASWFMRRKGKIFARRFDHIFASRSLNALACRYLHQPREVGLSDHSAIEATFSP